MYRRFDKLEYSMKIVRSVFLAKENHGSKMGWFGWTILSVILVTIIGSFLFFFNIFNLDIKSIFSSEKNADGNEEPVSEETMEKVEEVQKTVGKDHTDIGKFVAEMHDFYNETTGYGRIASLDWEEQKDQANNILSTLDEKLSNVKDDALRADIERIKGLAKRAINEQETEHVRNLHRMFHDLDIALNNYNGYDTIWKVTETLKTAN